MKNLVISIAVLAVVLAGAFLMLQKPEQKISKAQSAYSPASEAKSASSPLPEISMDEIVKHAVKDDCWMAIDGGVYDVTKFIPDHPGSGEILKGCGIDATALFLTKGGKGLPHSQSAIEIRENFKIGILKTSD